MSKETRTIRPFTGLATLDGVLDETMLHLGPQVCLANEGVTVDLAPHEFLARSVFIQWGSDDDAFQDLKSRLSEGAASAEFVTEDLSIVVVASSAFLKLADIVFTCPLSEMNQLERVTDLTKNRRSAAFQAPFNGFTLDVYLVLSRSLPRKPLRPYLKGTWITWVRFRVETTHGPALLPPTPLTDEIRHERRLLAKTTRYLYFGDHNPIEPYTDQDQPVFYVDEKLLAQMNARRTAPASKAMQLQLAYDFVSAVIRRTLAMTDLIDLSYADVRSSLLGSVIRIAAGPGATDEDRNRLVNQLRDDPELVIARADHHVDLLSGYGDLLKNDEP